MIKILSKVSRITSVLKDVNMDTQFILELDYPFLVTSALKHVFINLALYKYFSLFHATTIYTDCLLNKAHFQKPDSGVQVSSDWYSEVFQPPPYSSIMYMQQQV